MAEPRTGWDGAPTPAYVYDLAEVRRCADALTAALPSPSGLYYALKANPHPLLVRELLGRGAHPEVTSTGELAVALAAGAAPDTVLYTGPGKRGDDVAAALAAGVRHFAVDSAHGVRQLAALAADHGVTVDYLLRLNPSRVRTGSGLVMTGVPTQFGADEETVRADAAAFTAHPAARFTGFQLYLATNIPDVDGLMEQFTVALDAAGRAARTIGAPVRVLDLGGGFAAPYATEGVPATYAGLRERLGAALDDAVPGWRSGRPQVVFEAGRGLVASSGRLVTRVLDVKSSHGRRVVVVDSGIHHLGGMAGLRRVPPLHADLLPLDPATPDRGAPGPARVCGSLCTPLDTWAAEHTLPPVGPGDLLEVPNVGAYGLTASLALFLGHPLPTEIVVDGAAVVHRSRLTVSRHELDPTEAPGRVPATTARQPEEIDHG